MQYEILIDEILRDKSSSYFIKDAIKKLEKRDIYDVLKDLEMLKKIYNLKLKEIHNNE